MKQKILVSRLVSRDASHVLGRKVLWRIDAGGRARALQAIEQLYFDPIAWSFYQLAKKQKLPRHLKDQLVRASSSVALNLHEGWGRRTTKDRTRFFSMALGSLREVQSIIKLEQLVALDQKADILGACIYKLVNSAQ